MKCWAGCSLSNILQAIGLSEADLFYDSPDSGYCQNKGMQYDRANLSWHWPWRKQVNTILNMTELQAALAEDFLDEVKKLDSATLTDAQKDILLEKISLSWSWINLAEDAGNLCFAISQKMRTEEKLNV